jgi:hypothetical protein
MAWSMKNMPYKEFNFAFLSREGILSFIRSALDTDKKLRRPNQHLLHIRKTLNAFVMHPFVIKIESWDGSNNSTKALTKRRRKNLHDRRV